MSRTSLVVPFFILKTDLICKMWILLIRTYWCKILLDCLHDALHGAGLDDDDEVNQLEGGEPRFQHFLLDILYFYLVQSDAMPAPEADSWLCFHFMIMIITCSISVIHVRRPLRPIALTPLSAGLHELALKLNLFFHTSHTHILNKFQINQNITRTAIL